MAKIYIAGSWRYQHLVELLTDKLREAGHTIVSFVENDFGENPNSAVKDHHGIGYRGSPSLSDWCHSAQGGKAFEYDTNGAMESDIVVYAGGGKDSAAELGMAYAKGVPIVGLWTKGEEFGLMRRMVMRWCYNWRELMGAVEQIVNPSPVRLSDNLDADDGVNLMADEMSKTQEMRGAPHNG